MNTHITVTNGKAFHEGVEVERDSFFIAFYGKHPVPDGAYPLPEGWEVVKEYWMKFPVVSSPNNMIIIMIPVWKMISEEEYRGRVIQEQEYELKITARLVRKEQKSDYVIHNPETSCIALINPA